MKNILINFRITKEEKEEFEDMALKSGLTKTDLFRFKVFHQSDLDAKLEQIITTTSKNLETHFEEKQKELQDHFKEKHKELQDHFEERFKAYANALFKTITENVDKKLNLEKRDYRDFIDERLNSLFHRIDEKHFKKLINK